MQRALYSGLILFIASGCTLAAGTSDSAGSEIYSGYYRQGFERSDFYMEDGGEGPYWLTVDDEHVWARIHAHYVPAPGRGGGVTVRLVIEGALNRDGGFGHLGAYAGELTVERVLEIEPMTVEAFDAWLADQRGPERH